MTFQPNSSVVIGLPTYGAVSQWLYPSMNKMVEYALKHDVQVLTDGYNTCYWARGSSIPINRYRIVNVGIEAKADYVLMIDTDMGKLPEDALNRLMQHGVDIVGALYFGKQPPFVPIASIKDKKGVRTPIYDYKKGDLIEVDGIGFGFVLLRVKMLKDIIERKGDRPLFAMLDGIGEDYYFCDLAKSFGYKVYVDPNLEIGHRGEYEYTSRDFNQWRYEIQKKMDKGMSARDAINEIVAETGSW